MYKDFLNTNVSVLVSPRTESFLEYKGILVSENEDTITLKNASISIALVSFQKNIFGGNMSSYKDDLESVTINKRYIMSINSI